MSYRQRWFDQVSWFRMSASVRAVVLTIGSMADEDGQGARAGLDRIHRILAIPRINARNALIKAEGTGLIKKDDTYAGTEARWRLVLSAGDNPEVDHGAAID